MSEFGNTEVTHTEVSANAVIDAARVTTCVCTMLALGHPISVAQARCVKTAK